jgi:hypothetical protein
MYINALFLCVIFAIFIVKLIVATYTINSEISLTEGNGSDFYDAYAHGLTNISVSSGQILSSG